LKTEYSVEYFRPFNNRACGFCHMPYVGLQRTDPSVNLTMVAYPDHIRLRWQADRERYTYSSSWVRVLISTITQASLFGGNSGIRDHGYLLGDPAANQARALRSISQEQRLPDTACIAFRLQSAVYVFLYRTMGAMT